MKPPCFVNATARERGFTLLELMLAMAVTALLLVLLASVASQGLQNSRQINETVRMQSDATAALGMIASDLQALAIDVRPIEVLECQAETVRGVNSSWLMGLSRVYDNPGSNKQQNFGELRAFSYRMAYGDPVTGGTSGNTCVYGLYRKALTTGTTRSSILGAMLANPDQGLSMNYWNQTDATTGKSNATPGTDDYLVAIEEGSTLVRIGRGIFGERH